MTEPLALHPDRFHTDSLDLVARLACAGIEPNAIVPDRERHRCAWSYDRTPQLTRTVAAWGAGTLSADAEALASAKRIARSRAVLALETK